MWTCKRQNQYQCVAHVTTTLCWRKRWTKGKEALLVMHLAPSTSQPNYGSRTQCPPPPWHAILSSRRDCTIFSHLAEDAQKMWQSTFVQRSYALYGAMIGAAAVAVGHMWVREGGDADGRTGDHEAGLRKRSTFFNQVPLEVELSTLLQRHLNWMWTSTQVTSEWNLHNPASKFFVPHAGNFRNGAETAIMPLVKDITYYNVPADRCMHIRTKEHVLCYSPWGTSSGSSGAASSSPSATLSGRSWAAPSPSPATRGAPTRTPAIFPLSLSVHKVQGK